MIITYQLKILIEDSSGQPIPKDASVADRIIDAFPTSKGSISTHLIGLIELKKGKVTRALRAESLIGDDRELKEQKIKKPKPKRRRRRKPSTNLTTLYSTRGATVEKEFEAREKK